MVKVKFKPKPERGTAPKAPEHLRAGAQRTFRDGFWAFHEGKEMAPPFTVGSPPWQLWRRGYNFAKFNPTTFASWAFSDLKALEMALDFVCRIGPRVNVGADERRQNHQTAFLAKCKKMIERKTWHRHFKRKIGSAGSAH